MKTFCVVFILMVVFVNVVVAKMTSEDKRQIYDDIAIEYDRCAAYYSVVSLVLKKSNSTKNTQTYAAFSKQLYKMSNKMATITANKKEAKKLTKTRFNTYKKNMLAEINNDASKISILSDKHLKTCKIATSSFKEFIEFITDKHIKRVKT